MMMMMMMMMMCIANIEQMFVKSFNS